MQLYDQAVKLCTHCQEMCHRRAFEVNEKIYFITKTCLFKYTEKLITEKSKIFRQKIQIFFIFLLKT